MQIPTFWRARCSNLPAGNRLVRFRKILASALQVGGYRATLREAGITLRTLSHVKDLDATLRLMPELRLDHFMDSPTGFTNPLAPTGTAEKFISPFRGQSRTAILAPGFAESGTVRSFEHDAKTALQHFEPELLVAPVSSLLRQARQVEDGTISLAFLKHGIVALSGIVEGTLDAENRDLLWRVFGVPVYEQYLGWDGKVIARECEAHEGLHLAADSAVIEKQDTGLLITSLTDLRCPTLRLQAGVTGAIQTELCPCGRPEPRLTELKENKGAASLRLVTLS